MSESFCETCDRVRITADGQFRSCLFATDETDVRALLRDGSSDDVVAEALERTVAAKWAGHQINQVRFIRPRRSMSEIGADMTDHGFYPSRPARAGPDGRCHAEGAVAPSGNRPWSGPYDPGDRVGCHPGGDQEG